MEETFGRDPQKASRESAQSAIGKYYKNASFL